MSLHERATAVIPGGVNSPVRAFKSVGGNPLHAVSAEGPILRTADGRELIDFCLSFGPLMLGHAHPDIVHAVRDVATRGTSFAVTTEAEIEMAERIAGAVETIEKVRLVNSGTEAVMTAVRLARGITGRNKVLKFSGCYHGHLDSMLVSAGSGVAGIASASSAGVTEAAAAHTVVAPYNDVNAVTALVDEFGDELALITCEPIAANMGLVPPEPKFLLHLREQADRCGALLLFDEVITGFRVTYGGWQNLCCAKPDLTCLGKVIGGGLPIGAVGGPAKYMDQLAPAGNVYQAGTLSGNPISVAAGLANLRRLEADDPYAALAAATEGFATAVRGFASAKGIDLQVPTEASLFSLFFNPEAPTNFAGVKASDPAPFVKLFHGLLERGVYLAPSPFECGFLSTAHTPAVIDRALEAFEGAFADL